VLGRLRAATWIFKSEDPEIQKFVLRIPKTLVGDTAVRQNISGTKMKSKSEFPQAEYS
jgi:hypothetical protein